MFLLTTDFLQNTTIADSGIALFLLLRIAARSDVVIVLLSMTSKYLNRQSEFRKSGYVTTYAVVCSLHVRNLIEIGCVSYEQQSQNHHLNRRQGNSAKAPLQLLNICNVFFKNVTCPVIVLGYSLQLLF